jgi:hypothetical protein
VSIVVIVFIAKYSLPSPYLSGLSARRNVFFARFAAVIFITTVVNFHDVYAVSGVLLATRIRDPAL